ncbi:MarR family winged helix-turn-helix transcriptional regulator [Pseudophaeobacter arcticus]|jgi:DNA-binding MarR family transcriptional regulator|uniref:MarR family winged helix-turn-helix transcriptional regulator n=1 Tax=Pseudophaeobacter arcticus TaxID=385492 RepID=UPI00040B6DCC|nr:MarR family transcriptional regulator [Pseudophaeobacter arcticus]
MEHVDFITGQWARERPDLDVSAMGIIGRVARLYLAYQEGMQATFARFGLNAAKFDVLATLRRSGAPYRLSPGDLLKATMVASGTMTNRISRLEAEGLVLRQINPQDSRSFLIELSAEGLALIDQVVEEHVATQERLLAAMPKEERSAFKILLSRAQAAVDKSGG